MKWYESGGQPINRGVVVLGVIAASICLVVLQIQWMETRGGEYLNNPIEQFSRIIDQQTLRVVCDACDGAGLVREEADPEKLEVCDLCFGLGVHRLRQIHYSDVLCPECRGLARVPTDDFNHTEPCGRCGGRGLVTITAERYPVHAKNVPCRHCDGRGVVRSPEDEKKLVTCVVCYGLGGNLIRMLDDHSDYCISCDGMGRVYDPETHMADFCERCRGRGILVEEPVRAATDVEQQTSVSTTVGIVE